MMKGGIEKKKTMVSSIKWDARRGWENFKMRG